MYKDFKYIKNVSEDGTSALMLLNKRIGNAYDEDGRLNEIGIQGTDFANEMLYLKAVEKIDNITVNINSIGGDVIDGYNIVSAIMQHKANTCVTGLAASMAGLCAIAGEERSIVDYGTIMCHPVSGSKDAKVSAIIQDTLKTLYMGRTRMNADTVDNIFSKETYYSNSKKADYTLQDAVDAGVVDKIISSGKKLKALNVLKKDVNSLANIYNSLNTNKMDKITAVLNLKNEASEEAIVESIETLKTDLEAKSTELATEKSKAEAAELKATELQAKLDAIEAEKEAAKTAEATAAVENAIKLGKVQAADKDAMLVLAKTNLTAFNTLVSASKSTKEATKIEFGKGDKDVQNSDDRSNWDYITWSKKDEKGLLKMKNETPELYMELLNKLKK